MSVIIDVKYQTQLELMQQNKNYKLPGQLPKLHINHPGGGNEANIISNTEHQQTRRLDK